MASLLVLAASGWSLAMLGDEALGGSSQRKVRLVSNEEEFFNLVGAAPVGEVLSLEEYGRLAEELPERVGRNLQGCHVHCRVTPSGVVCVPHKC